jgi:large subunit ribosomal protein L17
MRHKLAGRRLNRTSEHRVALRRNLVSSLIEHETVSTTMAKAKEAKIFADKMITLAKDGTLPARRRAIALLGDRDIIEYEDDKAVRKGTIIGKLFSELGPRYLDRTGGYTRIIRLSLRRLGDNGPLVLLQLIGPDEASQEKAKARTKKRRRKIGRAKAEPEESTTEQAVEQPEAVADDESSKESQAEKPTGEPDQDSNV